MVAVFLGGDTTSDNRTTPRHHAVTVSERERGGGRDRSEAPLRLRSHYMEQEAEKKKLIIDTDPGIGKSTPRVSLSIELYYVSRLLPGLDRSDDFVDVVLDDAMAIFVALRSPEVEVLGLTTVHGNVHTTLSTRNALHLLEIAGRTDIPVAEGAHVTLMKVRKLRIADFVHGADGLGNQNFPPPKGKAINQSAATFLVQQARLYPGQITVVALGPLTNIALAIQMDPKFPKLVKQLIILGGSFSVNGNVNPAAEANVFCDPEAADVVFTCGADILAVGINVTHQVIMTDEDRNRLAQSGGEFARYLNKILDVYFTYHFEAYGIKGVYLHDPTAFLAAVDPSLLIYTEGVVRVQTTGITRGLTLFSNAKKRFCEITEWTDKPTIKVAVTVDSAALLGLFMKRIMNS